MMKIGFAFVVLVFASVSALADDTKLTDPVANKVDRPVAPEPLKPPDPGKEITLTFGDLNAIVGAQVAEAQAKMMAANARAALDKLDKQIHPPKP